MTLSQTIKSRRSIRMFKPEAVDPALIAELLQTALYAPNHRFTEPWRFIYLSGSSRDAYAELRAKDAAARGKDPDKARQTILEVPAILMVVAQRSPENAELDLEDYAATCCSIQNFLLLAWEQGLGTSWKTFPDKPELREFMGLKAAEHERVAGVIYLGYPAELPPLRERKSASAMLTFL
jgi:nitroreductase